MAFDGGYYLIRTPLINDSFYKHTAAHPDAVSDEMLRGVNIVQSTARRINQWVLDVMRELWVSGNVHEVLPEPDPIPVPDRLPEEVFKGMTSKERSEYIYERSKIHSYNARLEGKRYALIRQLSIAENLRNQTAIYYPHFIDFRGRLYPIPQDLTPQGDDPSKALLMFSESKPLGEAGLYWLAIRLANTFGNDKLTFDDRIKWVVDNEELIIDSGQKPLRGDRFWMEADEPWCFLATCREWFLAHSLPTPEEFESHLPISLDGTCNGLQHLSLLGRDPVGAKATNCSADPGRYDIYQEVADAVLRMLTEDAVNGIEEAHHWITKGIDRSTVKRAVMTTPYGVTDRGIQDQLIADRHTEGLDGGVFMNAKYMREKIVDALSETVEAARAIMAYLQDVSGALAEVDRPFSWVTPSGMTVHQSYWNMRMSRVATLTGRVHIWSEDEEMGLNKRKQILASAPNVIHSFDASMLVKTAMAMYDGAGVSSFEFVHDSYGTHACDTGLMSETLRRVAYEMYKEDQLGKFHERLVGAHPDVAFPNPPERGNFDVSEVLKAPYFFA